MVNSTNYYGMSGSVHYGRTNIWNRYHMNASLKAARTPMMADSVFFVAPAQHHCHISGFGKVLMGINSFFGGLFGGYSLTSGQGMPGMGMGGMYGGMGMGGMGMGGMFGGMGGMRPPGMGGFGFFC